MHRAELLQTQRGRPRRALETIIQPASLHTETGGSERREDHRMERNQPRCTTTGSSSSLSTFKDIHSLLGSQVERASTVLEQVEAELPDGAGVTASSEELQDVLQSWEQYRDRLDCEQRALSALELRTARLLAVPAHLEQAPPTPLCQKLQMMQARYSR